MSVLCQFISQRGSTVSEGLPENNRRGFYFKKLYRHYYSGNPRDKPSRHLTSANFKILKQLTEVFGTNLR